MRRVYGFLTAGSLLGLLACSSTLMPSRATTRDDLSELKRRVLELQQQAAVTQVELDRVRRELALLQAKLATSRRLGVDSAVGSGTDSLNQGEIEESAAHSVAPDSILESSDLPYRTITPLISDVNNSEETQADSTVPDPIGQTAEAGENPATRSYEPLSSQAQALYDRGYTLYYKGRYVDAESGFRRFLQIHPQTELSDNAQYWIGECRYARGDIRGALAAFQETVERYPDGNKVPDAILKLARCLQELGANEAGQARYDEVIRRFPNTAAATLAKERRLNSD